MRVRAVSEEISAPKNFADVAETGEISVSKALPRYANSKKIRQEFQKQMRELARRMARTNLGHRRTINRALMSELERLFEAASYTVLLTEDQISSRQKEREVPIFVLKHIYEGHFAGVKVSRPHKGNLVLREDENGLYIPLGTTHISFPLTEEAIATIRGESGENIRRAFYAREAISHTKGKKEKKVKVNARSTARDRTNLAEMHEALSGRAARDDLGRRSKKPLTERGHLPRKECVTLHRRPRAIHACGGG